MKSKNDFLPETIEFKKGEFISCFSVRNKYLYMIDGCHEPHFNNGFGAGLIEITKDVTITINVEVLE